MSTPNYTRGVKLRTNATRHSAHHSSPQYSQATSTARLSNNNPRHSTNSINRKRLRDDGLHQIDHAPPPSTYTSSFTQNNRTESPPPFVNTKYRLAGGLDTPTESTAEGFERAGWEVQEDDFRRRWSGIVSERDVNGGQIVTVGALARERNGGRKRSRSAMEAQEKTQDSGSWTRFVTGMVSGLASRVWGLCWGQGFKGFTAGGNGTENSSRASTWVSVESNGQTSIVQERDDTPVPGQFPEDDEEQDYHTPDEPEMRGTKRRQTGKGGDWVVVNHRDAIPPNARNSPSVTSSPHQRSMLPRPSASRTASTKYVRPSTARLSHVSHSGSPHSFGERSASTASPRASSISTAQKRSPAEVEIERYTAKRERDARQTDASMRKLNQQLKNMIKEGKEALATKVEIEDDVDMDDGGFVDR